jgi:hypothetical protein
MNSQKLSSLILGVFTTAVALSLLLVSSKNHQQTKGGSVRSEVADGSGPVPPPVHPLNVLLADGSGPVPPPVHSLNVLLADGSGPVPPPVHSLNVLLADGSGHVPPPVHSLNVLLADGSGPVPPPVRPNQSPNFVAV